MRILQKFEEFKFEFEGRTLYGWFEAFAIIEQKQGDNPYIRFVDVYNFEYAESMEAAGEGQYLDATPEMRKYVEKVLTLDNFRI
jgi:hypothetical protein